MSSKNVKVFSVNSPVRIGDKYPPNLKVRRRAAADKKGRMELCYVTAKENKREVERKKNAEVRRGLEFPAGVGFVAGAVAVWLQVAEVSSRWFSPCHRKESRRSVRIKMNQQQL